MSNEIELPRCVAAKLAEIAAVIEKEARNLERALSHWGEGEQDCILDDGAVDEWSVNIEHSEVGRLIANLRSVSEFADWLSQFKAESSQ